MGYNTWTVWFLVCVFKEADGSERVCLFYNDSSSLRKTGIFSLNF